MKAHRIALVVAGLLLATAAVAPAAETLLPRRLHSKERAPSLNATGRSARLVVKFHEGTGVRAGTRGLEVAPGFPKITHPQVPRRTRSQIQADLAVVDSIAAGLRVRPEPLIADSPAALAAWKSRAQSYWHREVADLGLYFQLVLTDWGRGRNLPDLVARLNQLPAVEIAYAEPLAAPPTIGDLAANPVDPWACGPDDVTVPAPDFEALQGYLAPTPIGVDAFAAWTYPGGDGEGIRVIDVEGGYREHSDHRELFQLVGHTTTQYWQHGQSVIGIIASLHDGFGTSGIAHGAHVGFRSIYNANFFDDFAEANASSANVSSNLYWAAKHSMEGVVLVELHRAGVEDQDCLCAGGSGCSVLPVEYWPADFDVISSASGNGVVVVEAAGNGGYDLDNPVLGGAFDRDLQDSGAVLSTGSEPLTRAPLCSSGSPNTGSRVDLHSWGEDVVTAAHGTPGNRIHDDGVCNTYIDNFSGSSSASAIVAGAAASLQGAALANLGERLDPLALRALLVETGTPQAVHPDGLLIGPQPDLAAALAELLP